MAIVYATDENFHELINTDCALVDFFGVNCGPCKLLASVLEDIDEELSFLNIVKVDVDACSKTSEEYKIYGMPDLYFMKNGETLYHCAGLIDKDQISEKLAEIMY